MIPLDTAALFVGWATGFLGWQVVLGFRREVVFGATWVTHVFVLILGSLALIPALLGDGVVARDLAIVALLVLTAVTLAVSVVQYRRRRAGGTGVAEAGGMTTVQVRRLDGVSVLVGAVATVVATLEAGGPVVLSLARSVMAAATLGGLAFAMVFSHRLLAKEYLGREPFEAAAVGVLAIWPLEVAVMLWPTGMWSALNGTIDDGYGGILGWMWALCAVTTLGLLVVARVMLADREHAKLASSSGMFYLAGLTGAGAVLISRAVLSG